MAVRKNRLTSTVLTEDDYVSAIEPPCRTWLVEADGHVLAFAAANAATGNIWALFVDPDHEGRGYGRQLHDAMVAWLWEQGVTRAWLTTTAGTRAHRFYVAAGGHWPVWYHAARFGSSCRVLPMSERDASSVCARS
jgi:GNAT superfamily N-acetyltransferase